MAISSDHKHARRQLFERFGENVPSEAFDYFATEDGILVQYLESEKDHLAYQDVGVRGSIEESKAPESPFKYASKTVPPGNIFEWLTDKNLTFRDPKTGRFMSRIKTAKTVARSIAETGLYPKNYWSDMDVAIAELTEDVIEMDTKFLELGLDTIIEIYES